MNITWKVSQLDRMTSDGFVTAAYWQATAIDGNYSASIHGSCGWTVEAPTIPYDQLTQDIVLGWVWATNLANKEATEARLAAKIEMQKNPTKATGVPW
jgi:hypothetical protein